MKLTTHLHLEPRSRFRGAITPFLQYALMAWCSVKAQGQLYLYTVLADDVKGRDRSETDKGVCWRIILK
jgi:hypothetical protein